LAGQGYPFPPAGRQRPRQARRRGRRLRPPLGHLLGGGLQALVEQPAADRLGQVAEDLRLVDQPEQRLGVAERRDHQAEQPRMGLGQALEQRRGVLAGQPEVADQHVDRLGVQLRQRLVEAVRAQQAVAAGRAECLDAGQGIGRLVEQQHVERGGRARLRRPAGERPLARGDLRGLAQGRGHFLRVPGLGQVAEDAAAVQRLDRRVQVRIAGKQDAQGLRGDLPRPGEQFRAVHLRHALVADDDVYRLVLQAL